MNEERYGILQSDFYKQFKTGEELYQYMEPFAEIAEYQAKQQDLTNALQVRLQGQLNLRMTHNEFLHLENQYENLGEEPNPEELNDEAQAIYFAYRRTCPTCHRIWSCEQDLRHCCTHGTFGCEDCEFERIEILVTQQHA